MEEKFRELKSTYSNSILFFKLGEYYDSFYEDAKIVSRVCWFLEPDKSIPRCSVPVDCIDECVDMLESLGYSVEIIKE